MKNILIINAGSSSIKFKLFSCDDCRNVLLQLEGQISEIYSNKADLKIKVEGDNNTVREEMNLTGDVYKSAIAYLVNHPIFKIYAIDVVINRVVHGGDQYRDILLLDDVAIEDLKRFTELAPLHQPINLMIAKIFMEMYAKIEHYACFDTAFHQSIPMINRLYALPWRFIKDGVKRYGFHGLSYQYIGDKLPRLVDASLVDKKWVVAHLGSGSSLCALEYRKSVATTMGFSVVEGVPMATRCGELDPAVIFFLQQKYGYTMDEISNILFKQSGLLGLSNDLSCSMKELELSTDDQAKIAVEFFCIQVASFITKLATLAGGIDGIIFTGGIGENSAGIRMLICNHLSWIGLKIDNDDNMAKKLVISKDDSKIKVLVVDANEEMAMVNQYMHILYE